MTLKVDGTNGVLQAYDYQVLTTGFSYTFASGTQTLIANPAGTLATGTITMPASPVDGMVITVQSTQQVTALTVAANTGQTLVGGATQLIPNQPLSFVYRLSNTTWYPYAGGAGRASSVVIGTSVATTSGTSIDFTGIPSWAKRITVVSNNILKTGTTNLSVQLGTAGGVTSSGYVSVASYCGNSNIAGYVSTTSGWSTAGDANTTQGLTGMYTIINISGNTWVSNVCGSTGASGVYTITGGGNVTLSGVLTRLRVTTLSGTDTFTAGSVNILVE